MRRISNNIKACLLLSDMSTPELVMDKEKFFTVQSFDYQVFRLRNEMGVPYGPTQRSILHFAVRSLPDGYSKELYSRLKEIDTAPFSFVMNATFVENEYGEMTLQDYESAFVATGYIIGLDEVYGNDDASLHTGKKNEADVMQMEVSVLLESITYKGNNEYCQQLNIN